MILQALHALHARIKDEPEYEVAPPGYSLQKVAFKVVLRIDGTLFDIEDARILQKPRPLRVLGNTKPPGSGLNPCLLWDTTGYLLGYKPEDKDPDRSREAFEELRRRHLEVEHLLNSQSFSAVCRFLESWSPERAIEFPVLVETKTGFGVFQIVGEARFVHQDPIIDSWWRSQPGRWTAEWWHDQLQGGKEPPPEGECLLTGEWGRLARLHSKIKGAASGDSSLVSFDKDSHRSYGKEQSFNAPVSESAAQAYTSALNAILDGPMKTKHRMRLGDTTVAFWTEKPSLVEDIFAQFAEHGEEPTPDAAQDAGLLRKLDIFLRALREGVNWSGNVGEDPAETRFFMLGLSPNQGRLTVRFFLRGSVRELLDNLRRHHREMSVERKWGEGTKRPDLEFPPTWMFLDQTCPRDKNGKPVRDQIPPILPAPLLRAVITGARYPDGLYSAVIRRIRADRDVNYLRASIIRGMLIRNHQEEVTMSLDPDRADPAYRLGRLFAVLERLQERAFYEQTGRNLEKGIRDSYFSAACATPASVFPRLERLSTHHRRQLSGGQKHFFDQLVADIKDPLDGTPSVLPLKEQGIFLLGYYHQWKALRSKKSDSDAKEE